jgi:Emfourin
MTLPARADNDDCVKVERVGGLAGFGGPRLQSAGEVALSALSAKDRKAIEAMFRGAARAGAGKPDGFVYRITRRSRGVTKTVEVSEEHVPEAVRKCVKSALE